MNRLPHTDNVVSFLPASLFLLGLARYPVADYWPNGRAFIPAVLWLITSSFVLYWLRSDHSLRGARARPWLSAFSILPLLQVPVIAGYIFKTRPSSTRLVAVGLMLAFYVGCFFSYAGGASLGRRWFV